MYAIKRELKLNKQEKILMDKHIGFNRFCYNYALSIYEQLDHKEYPGGSSKKINKIRTVFTNYTKKNPDFSWTQELSSRVYQNAFKSLKTSFTRFWKGISERPVYKKKKNPGSFTVDGSDGVILQEGKKKIKLPTLGTFRLFEAIPKCVSQTYTVSKKGNKYYVAFSICAELIPPIMHEVNIPTGLDVNLTDGKYCVLSDNTNVTYPKPLKAAKTKLRKLQYANRNKRFGNRRKKIENSNNAKKYFKKLAKFHQKIANKRNDFLQKLTTNLARKYYHLKLETLNIKGMMANSKLAFHVADASFYQFKILLENKVKSHGGIVEFIDQWYPSSKLCSQCQNKKENLQLKDRLYICENHCCKPICRDLNSAINLQNAPLDKIVTRVGSTRINACGQFPADGTGGNRK